MYLADNNDDDIESMPNLFRNAAKLFKENCKVKAIWQMPAHTLCL